MINSQRLSPRRHNYAQVFFTTQEREREREREREIKFPKRAFPKEDHVPDAEQVRGKDSSPWNVVFNESQRREGRAREERGMH